jgi:glycosyltransferase involved in cell wall biosynthesis
VNVVLTGWLDYRRFLGELMAAHVVAAFSTDPGIMNRAAFEAIGLGKALVLTNFDGLRERFGPAARYCRNVPEEMVSTLQQALRDRSTMEANSVAAQDELRGQWDAGVRKVKELLAAVRQPDRVPPRRVLMVSQHPYPFASVLRRNVDHLLATGLEVDLVCTADGPPMAPSRHRALRVYRIAVKHRRRPAFWYAVEYLIFFLMALPLVSWLGLRRRYEVVQIDNLPDFLAFSAFVPRLRGSRTVLHMWEVMPEMTAARLGLAPGHPLVQLAAWSERLVTRWVDHVITVNDACRRVLIGRGVPEHKVSTVFNTQPDLSGSPPAQPSQPVLITHGTLVERYGVQVAIRALRLLRSDWPAITLQVVGGGEYQATLEALARDLGIEQHVLFQPWLSFADMLNQIRTATLGIVPVIADGYGHVILPTKLFDYVAEGIPTVCSRLPAVEARFPSEAVAYFTAGDATELAREIDRLLGDPSLARKQAQRAKEALRAIDWQTMSRQYLVALGAT